jgi:hypothetical protein
MRSGSVVMNAELGRIRKEADRLCGLEVRVSGYRSRGSGFDSRSFQIF